MAWQGLKHALKRKRLNSREVSRRPDSQHPQPYFRLRELVSFPKKTAHMDIATSNTLTYCGKFTLIYKSAKATVACAVAAASSEA